MEEFSFPFEPYDIQLNLMRQIKTCIDNREIGIFESPTGTGKSLSVLCSTMTWLEQEEKRAADELDEKLREAKRQIKEAENDDQVDWVEAHKNKLAARKVEEEVLEKIGERRRVDERIANAKCGKIDSRKRKKTTNDIDDIQLDGEGNIIENDELAPPDDDYNSDGELVDKPEDENEPKCVKVYYASRTHSQLEQLCEELEKTRFRPRIVTCASRSTLCVNEDVKKLKFNHLINERCMELRKNTSDKKMKNENGKETKRKKCNSCEYYNQHGIEEIVNGILSTDLNNTEKIVKKGNKVVGCPYFATRHSVPLCELVLLPYQVILHGPTRDAWGIELNGNVVVLDEAHNVLNTISSLYSSEISTRTLTVALKLIREYIETYKSRLKPKNLLYMRQLLAVANSIILFLNGTNGDQVLTISQLLIRLNIVEINLFKLSAYIEKMDLCKKFHGFYLRLQANEVKKKLEKPKVTGIAKLLANKNEEVETVAPENTENKKPAVPSPLFTLQSFINSLTNRCEDGRVVVEKVANSEARLRYNLLNPSDRLAEVVKCARSTILVGGTMEPAQLLIETLTRGDIGAEIRRFSCSHVIEDNQLMSLIIDKTVDGKPFQLTYQTRNNDVVLKSLATSLQALMPHLPNGVVIFVPSYDFLFNFQKKLKEFGVLVRIEARKKLFFESRSPTADIWESYCRAAKSDKGAVMFAVVGGKLSEGINFSDELGRAVIVIGLPYPNKNSVELAERMRFLDTQMPNGGSLLYESLCMHAVNQAIGRAIRHRRDYASVYLFDERFERVQKKLSGWIGEKTHKCAGFGDVIRKTNAFFKSKC